nr:MAG: replication associated protein [Cressdnaviricota sp.]
MPQGTVFCFTSFCHKESKPVYDDTVQYLVYQIEETKDAKKHYQGYVEFKRTSGVSDVKRIAGRSAHVEQARCPDAAAAYCFKEDTRVEGPFHFGSRRLHGNGGRKRGRVDELAERIVGGEGLEDVCRADPGAFARAHAGLKAVRDLTIGRRDSNTPCHVEVRIGPFRSGKSRGAREDQRGSPFYTKPADDKWWNDYAGEKIVIIDDFDGSDAISPTQLLRICDRYPMAVETKGGTIQLLATKIIFTTSMEVSEWYRETKYWGRWQHHQNAFMARVNECGAIIRTEG